MKSEQLFKAIEEDCLKHHCYSDYIVRVRYKYEWVSKWIYSNEYLEWEGDAGDWCWLHDWNEGRQDIEFLGFIAVDDIYVPTRKE